MQNIIRKTGLGLALQEAIADTQLQSNQKVLMNIMNEVFASKFDEFKKNHSIHFPSISVKGNYLIDNEFPIGEGDKHQYFRCLAHELKIGNITIVNEGEHGRRSFSLIEAYSKNQSKKRSYSRMNVNRRSRSSHHATKRKKTK